MHGCGAVTLGNAVRNATVQHGKTSFTLSDQCGLEAAGAQWRISFLLTVLGTPKEPPRQLTFG